MLYTLISNVSFRFSRRVNAAILLWAVLAPLYSAYAEEKIIIPKYDDVTYEDGSSRWAKFQNSQPTFYFTRERLFSASLELYTKQKKDVKSFVNNIKTGRFDRTNNYLPLTFSISAKGYCIYEINEYSSKYFSLDRIDMNFIKKPTIFLGFQQAFF